MSETAMTHAMILEAVLKALSLDQPGTDDPWLTVREAADCVKVSQGTLRVWISSGLPVVRVGRVTRIRRSALDAWLTSACRAPAPQQDPTSKVDKIIRRDVVEAAFSVCTVVPIDSTYNNWKKGKKK